MDSPWMTQDDEDEKERLRLEQQMMMQQEQAAKQQMMAEMLRQKQPQQQGGSPSIPPAAAKQLGKYGGEYIAPAAAMYGLVEGGNKLDIGANSQKQEYDRFFNKMGKELGREAKDVEKLLKFWEWF